MLTTLTGAGPGIIRILFQLGVQLVADSPLGHVRENSVYSDSQSNVTIICSRTVVSMLIFTACSLAHLRKLLVILLAKNPLASNPLYGKGISIYILNITMTVHGDTYYKPDDHCFEYIALVPWPGTPQPQIDWLDHVLLVESWLEAHVGSRHVDWAWSDHPNRCPWHACVAFKDINDHLLFCLQFFPKTN